jgi:hypothetical protein
MPFCPKCRDEFQEWVQVCPDCHVPLVDVLKSIEKQSAGSKRHRVRDNIVTIASSLHPEEAYILSEKLKAAGLRAFVADEHMAGIFGLPPVSTRGASVQVFESNSAEARKIISAADTRN